MELENFFKNYDKLTNSNRLRERIDLLKILYKAIEAVDPYNCVKEYMKRDNSHLFIGDELYDLSCFKHIYVVGMGKAAIPMAEAVYDILGERVEGYLNAPKDEVIGNLICHKAGHPIPDEDGVEGAKFIWDLVSKAGANDLVICLISGGGSAMAPLPKDGISLADKQLVTELLLKSGADIHEINKVRKYLSKIKGGGLARQAYPAKIVSLILSDVVGDSIETIASGPTFPVFLSKREVISIIRRYDLEDRIPSNVKKVLEEKAEEPPNDDVISQNIKNIIVGSNIKALKAAFKKSKALGYNAIILTSTMEGEAKEVALLLMAISREIVKRDHPIKKPAIILVGGETTVTVCGKGCGGRNQELVLSGLRRIGPSITLAAMGTDGIDGNTPAAGAIGDIHILDEAKRMGLVIEKYLSQNDSYNFFSKTNGLIITGPTATNVADVVVVMVN